MSVAKLFILNITLMFTLITGSFAKVQIAVLTAVPSEATWFLQHLDHQQPCPFKRCIMGNYHQKRIAVMSAGVGIIDMAAATTQMIDLMQPNILLLSGTSGGLLKAENIGDVIVVTTAQDIDASAAVTQNHYQARPTTVRQQPPSFASDAKLVTLAASTLTQLPIKSRNYEGKLLAGKIFLGTIATTANFNISRAALTKVKKNHAAVAMETASFLKICQRFHKSCIAFRAISNKPLLVADNSSTKWSKANAQLAANNAARVALSFIRLL